MSGQPKIAAKRIRKLLTELGDWGNRFFERMPNVYKDRNRPLSGSAGTLWQSAADALAEHYAALEALSICLNTKAGYIEPEIPPEPAIEPSEVTADTILRFDGESHTLAEWCETYGTPIEPAKKRAMEGMDWELAVVLQPKEAGEVQESGEGVGDN